MRRHHSRGTRFAAGAVVLAIALCTAADATTQTALATKAPRSAQIFYVGGESCSDGGSGSESDPWCTLGRAFENEFVAGDVIRVLPGEYVFSKSLVLPGGITLVSTGGKEATVLRVENGAVCRHLDVVGNDGLTRIGDARQGFTFVGGRPIGSGGAIAITAATANSQISIEDCDFVDNRAGGNGSRGGAIFYGPAAFDQAEPFTFSLIDCDFRSNRAGDNGDGGAISFTSDSGNPAPILQIEGCVFEGNEVKSTGLQTFGGAVHINACRFGSVIRDCSFSRNQITFDPPTADGSFATGGAVYLRDARIALTDCTFTQNMAPRAGAVYIITGAPPPPSDVARCEFQGNVATVDHAGALYLDHLNYDVVDCRFEGNRAPREGGAIWALDGVRRFENCDFFGNSAQAGGAVFYHHHELTMVSCTLVDNRATTIGGAVAAGYTGILNQPLYEHSFEQCTFVNNDASPDGGAIYFLDNGPADGSGYTKASVVRCLIVNGNGGAVHWDGGAHQDVFVDCTNAYNNGPDEYGDEILCSEECIFDDPLFCDPADGDFRLSGESPCTPENSPCGELIGALEVGCGVSSFDDARATRPDGGFGIPWVRQEQGNLVYRIESDRDAEMFLQIVDVSGRRIASEERTVRDGVAAGSWNLDTEGVRMSTGVYLLSASLPGRTASHKFVWFE
ncbi:MAG: hypothetical protein R3E97_04150 [Candidatus Eisenbacteria bacterium]